MYKEIKGGEKVVIQDVECWIPPVGYVYNRLTNKLEKREILKSSLKKEDQLWFRTELPEDYNKKRSLELRKQELEPSYYDVKLESFRQ